MAEKRITQQFRTLGKNTHEDINTFTHNKIATGEVFDIVVDSMHSFDKQYIGGSEKWLMVVFRVKYHWAD